MYELGVIQEVLVTAAAAQRCLSEGKPRQGGGREP